MAATATSPIPLPQVQLRCADPGCQQAFPLDPAGLAAGTVTCPRCGGWFFSAGLAPSGGGR